MRIIGTDLVIGVYEAENKKTLPGMLALSKIDRIAGAGERLLYLFDQISGQIGLRFTQDIEGFPVYILEQPGMLLPLYYCLIDDIALLSTSLPLLNKTILQALGKIEDEVALFPFQRSIRDIPESRALTSFIQPARLFQELYRTQFLTSLQLVNRQDVNTASNFPFITLSLDLSPEQTILETAFIPAVEHEQNPSETRKKVSQTLEGEFPPKPRDKSMISQFSKKSLEEFPLVGRFQTAYLVTLLQTLETLFPQQFAQLSPPASALHSEAPGGESLVSGPEASFSWQWIVSFQKLFGKIVECRLSKTLLGTLYTVPDVACVSEPSNPVQADSFINKSIDIVMEQAFSSPTQRALVKKFNEPYQDTEIISIRLLLQDVLSYSLLSSSYAFLTTNTAILRKYIDLRLASPDLPLSFFADLQSYQEEPLQKIPPNVEMAVAKFFINNKGLSDWLKAISGTQTFSLIWPPKEFQELYHALPTLILVLESLPPAWFHVKLQGTNLLLSLEISEKAHK
jgi:hypothetical protein